MKVAKEIPNSTTSYNLGIIKFSVLERTRFICSFCEQLNLLENVRTYLKARGNVEEGQPLFTSTSNNSRGKRISTRTISGIVKTALKNAGYDSARLTAHSLRHSV